MKCNACHPNGGQGAGPPIDVGMAPSFLERGKTSGRSDDNDPEIIGKRIAVYKNETTPVFDHYAQSGKSLKINGVGSIENIFGRLCEAIEKL